MAQKKKIPNVKVVVKLSWWLVGMSLCISVQNMVLFSAIQAGSTAGCCQAAVFLCHY